MECWICGNDADSGEHRIKRSDLISLHGKGAYKQENAMVMVKSGKEIPIQGPNSKYLKYKKSLCKECNVTGTQNFDNAYSKFIEHIINNEKEIIRKRFIDFEDVYGEEFESGQRNLYKYFVKSFGCRVVEAGRKVPGHLSELLTKKQFQTNLFITFAINEDKVLLLEDDLRVVGNGDLSWYEEQDTQGNIRATYHEYYSIIHIFYWYNFNWDWGRGSRWVADTKYIYLGSFSPLPPEMRNEMIEKIPNDSVNIDR